MFIFKNIFYFKKEFKLFELSTQRWKRLRYIYALDEFFIKINFWPIHLCCATGDAHIPTCELLESDGIKNIEVVDAKNFPQRFADFCKFSKTFLNHFFPLRHLCY